MPSPTHTGRRLSLAAAAASVALLVAAILTNTVSTAQAADPAVGLGTAAKFAVLAGTTVTNTGSSAVFGDVGLSPGSSVTGFPPGHIFGTLHISDAVALQAKKDLTTAYDDAAGRPKKTDVTGKDLAGMTLTPGVYEASTSMALTGNLVLNAQGNPDAVFIFKAGSTLITGPNSTVRFINGGSSCNVFWQVGSSATLDSANRFIGTIMAHTSATLGTTTTLDGRVLAMTGAVTLHSNVITASHCATANPTSSATATATATGTGSTSGGSTSGGSTSGGSASGGSSTAGSSGSTGGNATGTAGPHQQVSAPATPSSTQTLPIIPQGHPHTGLGGSQVSSSTPPVLLSTFVGLVGLLLTGLLLAGLRLGRAEKQRT